VINTKAIQNQASVKITLREASSVARLVLRSHVIGKPLAQKHAVDAIHSPDNRTWAVPNFRAYAQKFGNVAGGPHGERPSWNAAGDHTQNDTSERPPPTSTVERTRRGRIDAQREAEERGGGSSPLAG